MKFNISKVKDNFRKEDFGFIANSFGSSGPYEQAYLLAYLMQQIADKFDEYDSVLESTIEMMSLDDVGSIVDLKVPDATELVFSIDDLDTLSKFEAAEEASPLHNGGRKGVLSAIKTRRGELESVVCEVE